MSIVTNGILTHRFDEIDPKPGMRLGRHMEIDAASIAYAIVESRAVIKPAEWLPGIPTLDQGDLGSCTGNAGTYALSAKWKDRLPDLALNGFHLGVGADEKFAVELYHEATIKDRYPGVYPPVDTGSSGLAVCKAAKAAGLITGYRHALNGRAVATLLQSGGCLFGVPWYEAWFTPDSNGFIDSGLWVSSGVAGGHELYFEALESWNEQSPERSVLRFRNSWGAGWGDHGCGRMYLLTYNQLRSKIDVQQFV